MKKNKQFLIIGAGALLLIVITLIFMPKDEPGVSKTPEIPSPWQPTTVPYDSKCEGECLENIEQLADIETSHLRGVKIVMRPDINDAVVQLGECLDSIMHCVDEKDDPTKTAECVTQSQCPTTCKEAYSKQFNAGMGAKVQLEGIQHIFLAENAVCAPREAGGVK